MNINNILRSRNPQQALMQFLGGRKNNPFLANLLFLAQTNNAQGLEQIARNLAKEKGIDFDKEFENFKRRIGNV